MGYGLGFDQKMGCGRGFDLKIGCGRSFDLKMGCGRGFGQKMGCGHGFDQKLGRMMSLGDPFIARLLPLVLYIFEEYVLTKLPLLCTNVT